MNKVEFFRSVFLATLVCMLVWYALLWLTDPVHRLTGAQTTAADRAIALVCAGTITQKQR
jgi:hypothetical protein